MKKVIITGASGFVGTALQNMFIQNGYEVIAVQRTQLKDESVLLSIVEGSYAIINLAGANIINRWSDEYKKLLYSSRIDTTKAIVNAIQKSQNKPKILFSTSAVGIYKNDKFYDETTKDTDLADDFLAHLCKDWENEAFRAKEFGVRVATFRFGIVMGEGGALGKMLLPFKLGVGGTIGDGKQAFSFIHISDLLNAYKFVLDNENLEGTFNLTAPKPTSNYGLTKALGKYLHRPTILPIPAFMLNLIFSEGAKVLTDGQSAIPSKLLESGFEFEYTNIEETIKNLV